MSVEQDEATTTVTAADVARIAKQGVFATPTSLDPKAVNVGHALIATLQGAAEKPLLTDDLQRLTEQVRQKATIGFPRITSADGIRLSAHTIKLNAPEPRPVVIVPSDWTPAGWPLFEHTYLKLALRGYHVLAYTPRGLGLTADVHGGGYMDGPCTSGGTIDVAGPLDWADGSTVIDYAQQHFNPSRIAFFGRAYGGLISQLVAAHDPGARVDAVVALSTWEDLVAGHQNDRGHLAAVADLTNFTGGPVKHKFDEDTQQILADLQAGENPDDVASWAMQRAAFSYVGQTNARGTATFISHAGSDALFPLRQITKHFEQLTVPKRLSLQNGSRPAPEHAGLTVPLSDTAPTLDEAFAWLDHHLLGAANNVPTWSPVSS